MRPWLGRGKRNAAKLFPLPGSRRSLTIAEPGAFVNENRSTARNARRCGRKRKKADVANDVRRYGRKRTKADVANHVRRYKRKLTKADMARNAPLQKEADERPSRESAFGAIRPQASDALRRKRPVFCERSVYLRKNGSNYLRQNPKINFEGDVRK